jgi:hypothetical protein
MKFLPILCLYLLASLALQARDLAAYRVGDVADADIITPVALEVVDPAATAALRSARARQYPAIFRSLTPATNDLTQAFLAAFARGRTNFLAEMAVEFPAATPDHSAIDSPDFDRLVTAFGVEHRDFPVPDSLAAEWARGGDGQAMRDSILAALLRAANRTIRPDVLPQGFIIGETVRLVPVAALDEKLPFETVQSGQLLPAAGLITVSNAQALFRREFPDGQQLFARALAAYLQPNCFPDAPFTQLTRGSAVYQLVVAEHFDAGDVLVRQGGTIDARIAAAVAALSDKLKSMPPPPSPAVAPVVVQKVQPAPPAAAPVAVPTVQLAPAAAAPVSVPKVQPATPAPIRAAAPVLISPPVASPPAKPPLPSRLRHRGIIFSLAGASIAALAVACWQFVRERRRVGAPAAAAQTPLPSPDAAKADLSPHVALAVREAVQQELASQRRELLRSQQAATDEIAALVRRLDELQVPMQQRLQTYENRIQLLEKELALRNEENRELLQAKLEVVRRQLQTEQAAALVPPVTAA